MVIDIRTVYLKIGDYPLLKELNDQKAMENDKGRIVGVSAGLYSVEQNNKTVYARSRGVFRQKGIKPVVGDYVELNYEENTQPVIWGIQERKNFIIRPPLANIDLAVLVVSSCEPKPNALILDKLAAIFESKGIETVFVFTKIDRADAEVFKEIYEGVGYKTFSVNNATGDGAERVAAYLRGKTSALIGNTGVGKSSLMNYIAPEVSHKTSEISKKLGRGKHTTREVRLYKIGENTYTADTPGFSTVEIGKYGAIPSSELAESFREFSDYLGGCRFKDCAHIKEDGCLLRAAAEEGKISRSRYDSYCKLFAQAVNEENNRFK